MLEERGVLGKGLDLTWTDCQSGVSPTVLSPVFLWGFSSL